MESGDRRTIRGLLLLYTNHPDLCRFGVTRLGFRGASGCCRVIGRRVISFGGIGFRAHGYRHRVSDVGFTFAGFRCLGQ